jgi:hypothetical protein
LVLGFSIPQIRMILALDAEVCPHCRDDWRRNCRCRRDD